ncbi:pyridoxamine 5'-phosphate oxidase family protein [Deinococcus pimensis]|uniref:pyridoxamine 5'-phosphate oxidase family protein n=1 Tax=Deinococcus pimensis TaxID=309888 RepID=UPI0004AE455B|nr:pyridoxamine 5'-phosphate oxidase family protein [Deinococcus pimensis]
MAQATEQMTHDQAVKKLADLVRDIRIAMFTSVSEDGSLHSRPMATQHTDFDGTLWFFTWRDSAKVDEFEARPNVNVAFSDPKTQTYVSVVGRARITDDAAKKQELWNPALKAWFPDGLDDPNLTLIKVDVDGAEYWDSPSSAVVHLYGVVKATLTGKPATDVGENKKIEL